MKQTKARIHSISIPFRFVFAHAAKKRASCDSCILEITDGTHTGFGEILIREYVTGLPGGCRSTPGKPAGGEAPGGGAAEGEALLRTVGDALGRHLSSTRGCSFPETLDYLTQIDAERCEYPLLCGLETAILELECRREGCDIYDLLGREPIREKLFYGIVLPILPIEKAAEFLQQIRQNGLENVRLKLGPDRQYNAAILTKTREVLGPDVRIVCDANSSWTRETVRQMLTLCEEADVEYVEDPVPAGDMEALSAERHAARFTLIADESFCTEQDLETIGREGHFGMLNLRVAKNGGILRTLEMADRAEALGLRYCLGCHVGETGILSAVGRVAASLLQDPVIVEGSYGSFLLSDHIVRQQIGIGQAGAAPVLRNNAIGYTVDTKKLSRYSIKETES